MATIPLMLGAGLYLVYRYLWEEKNIKKSKAAMYVGLGIAAMCGIAGLASTAEEFMVYVMGSVLFLPVTYFSCRIGLESGYKNAGRENAEALAELHTEKFIITAVISSLVLPLIFSILAETPYSFNTSAGLIGIFTIIALIVLLADVFNLEI